jgi:hypothetical protein
MRKQGVRSEASTLIPHPQLVSHFKKSNGWILHFVTAGFTRLTRSEWQVAKTELQASRFAKCW